jgi:hypothetical protein
MAVTAGVPGGVADDRPRATSQRSRWRSVAVPSEHGGWGLTAAVLLAVTACLVDAHVLTAMVIVAVMAGLHLVWIRRAPRPARVLGLRETALGAGLVLGTALGVLLG